MENYKRKFDILEADRSKFKSYAYVVPAVDKPLYLHEPWGLSGTGERGLFSLLGPVRSRRK